MHTKMSIIDRSGESIDVEVVSRHRSTLADVLQVLPVDLDLDSGSGIFNDGRLIRPDVAVGGSGIPAGSRLTAGRPAGACVDAGTLRLQVDAGPDAGTSFALNRGHHVLGRGPGVDLRVQDPELSRQHLSIEVDLHAVTIRDLHSTNGTMLNGDEISHEPNPLPPGVPIVAGHSRFVLAGTGEPPALTEISESGYLSVYRPPRPGPRWRESTFDVPDLIPGTLRPKLSWLAAALPALASIGLAVVFRSPQLLAFAAMSPISVIATAIAERRSWRRAEERRRVEHTHAEVAALSAVAIELAKESQARHRAQPGASVLLRAAITPDCRLWERRRTGSDFLELRLGLARLDSATSIRRNGKVQPAGALELVPATVGMAQGVLGIAGPVETARSVARHLVGQALTLHGPSDVELVALLDDASAPHWRWLRWADSHLADVASSRSKQKALIENLVRIMDERLDASRPAAGTWPGRWTLLLIDPAESTSELARFTDLLAMGPAVGITAICIGRDLRCLPSSCRATLALDPGVDGRAELRAAEQSSLHLIPDGVSVAWSQRLARALAPLRDTDESHSAPLPAGQRLSELLNLQTIDVEAIRQRWHHPSSVAVLGRSRTGPFSIDLVKDGPHILIAGTTGSGKSELLRTMVTSLGCQLPPDRLSFVLIDYKGGAAFAECAELPHVLGMVTDLDPSLTRRALLSLEAELRRREGAFASAGVTDLDAYHASRCAGQVPLSRLVLVIDEFATLAEELPEFLQGLLSIAQRGRSLGIHLVLATQRPAGVLSPDIKANMSLRIALRMTDANESSDVINDPSASRLSRHTPGRAWARRTDGDLIEFQTASVSLPDGDRSDVQVRILDEWNRPIQADESYQTTELHSLQLAMRAAAEDVDLPPRPWLDALPHSVQFAPEPGSKLVPFGLVDEPHRQRRTRLVHDLGSGGVVGIVGSARSGRTTALHTVLGTAVAQLNAADLHLYVIDLGGGLRHTADLPHCGTYAGADNPHHIGKLISRLTRELAERRRQLSDWGVSSVEELAGGGDGLATILLVVDGWDLFSAMSHEVDGGRTVDDLLQLMRDGAAAGFSFFMAGDRGLLAPRVSSVLGRKVLLPLTEPSDYLIAGLRAEAVSADMRPGRGIEVSSGCQVQLALLADDPASSAQRRALERSTLQNHDGGQGAKIRIGPLPARVLLDEIGRPGTTFRLGLGGDDARPLDCDLLAQERHFLIVGPARSGKSTIAGLIAQQALAQGLRTAVAATARSPLTAWADQQQVQVLHPADIAPVACPDILIIDDAEHFTDTPAGESVLRAIVDGEVAVVATARSDDLLMSFRGIGVEMRRHRTGIVLQPSSTDGELFGIRIPRGAGSAIPGRGLLITDATRSTADGYEPIQLAQA